MKDFGEESKGFKGLTNFSAKKQTSAVDADPTPNSPPTTGPAHPAAFAHTDVEASQTKPTTDRPLIIGSIVVAVIVALILLGSFVENASDQVTQQPADSVADAPYAAAEAQVAADNAAAVGALFAADAEAAAANAAAAASFSADAATAAADADASNYLPDTSNVPLTPSGDELRPDVGFRQVLYASQIRYCVREKIRLDAANPVIDTSNDLEVDRYNTLIDDYNGRCSSFRYRAGTLESIRSEAELVRAQLEAQGRNRVSSLEHNLMPSNTSSSPSASFDCKKAVTWAEKIICLDPELARLDGTLYNSYQRSRVNLPNADLVRTEQRTWLNIRNQCSDYACLKAAYESRIAQLDGSQAQANSSMTGGNVPSNATSFVRAPMEEMEYFKDSDGQDFTRELNANGAILRTAGEALYLGRTCDAYSPQYGNGEWQWHADGFNVEFSAYSLAFPQQNITSYISNGGGCKSNRMGPN